MPIDPSIPLSGRPAQIASPLELYGQLLSLKSHQQQMDLQKQHTDSLIADRNAQTAERQQQLELRGQALKSQQVVDRLMSTAMVQDQQTGVYTFDRSTFEQGLIRSGAGHLYPQMAETLDKLDKSTAEINVKRAGMVAHQLFAVQQAGNTPEALQTAAAYAKANHLIGDEQLKPVLDAVDQDPSPENIGRIVQALATSAHLQPEYQALVQADEKRKADLGKTQAEIGHLNAESQKALQPNAGNRKLVEVTEPDGSPGFRIFDAATGALSPLGAEGVGPKRPAQTPESMQLTEVTGPDGAPALANYSPRSGQLSPVQAPGFAPKQPADKTPAQPNLRTVNVVVDGQPKVATFNPQSGRLTVDGEDITGRAAPMQPQQAAEPTLQRADVNVDGQPTVANFNPRAGTYTDTSGTDISARVRPKSASEPSGSDFDKFLATYARERGKTPGTVTSKERLDARQKWALADNKPDTSSTDVKEAVSAMKEGTAPPQLPGRASKEYIAMIAESRRQGYDLATAATDWNATQRHVATLNNNQHKRMREAIDNASHSLDVIEGLAKQWNGGGFPLLNRANLALAKSGAQGPKAQQNAVKLEAEISDVTSELGNVYMGGGSPTDHSLKMAQKNLSADWSKDTLLALIKQSKVNLQIRHNSMDNVGVAGASPNNPYAPQIQSSPPSTAAPAPKVGDKVGRFEIIGVK